jgi:phosphoglycerate kinase
MMIITSLLLITAMASRKLNFRDVDLKNQTVLVRVDFNCPLTPDKKVEDNARIKAALPTVLHLLSVEGVKIILMSHLGRPDGKIKPEFSLQPVCEELRVLLGANVNVVFAPDAGNATDSVAALKPHDVLLLENLRFYPDEEKVCPVCIE